MIFKFVARKPLALALISYHLVLWLFVAALVVGVLLKSLADDSVVAIFHIENLLGRVIDLEPEPLRRKVHAIDECHGNSFSLRFHSNLQIVKFDLLILNKILTISYK